MGIIIGKHRIGFDGSGYQISRVSTRKKSGDEFQSDHAYYSTCEGACRALIERMVADKLADDAVQSVSELIAAVREVQDAAVKAVGSVPGALLNKKQAEARETEEDAA